MATCVTWAQGPSGTLHLCLGTTGGFIHTFTVDGAGHPSHASSLQVPDRAPVACLGSHLGSRCGGAQQLGEAEVLLAGTYGGTLAMYEATAPGRYSCVREIQEGSPVVGCGARGNTAVVGVQVRAPCALFLS